MEAIIPGILFIVWLLLWVFGGIWIGRVAFKLQPIEEAFIGLVIGLTAQVGLVNFIGRVASLPLAAWLSASIIFLFGGWLAYRHGGFSGLRFKIIPGQWIALVIITYIFFLISRGLALYDDYAHLPTLSLMATGDIPPRFALDPDIPLRYHYFVLLFGAQIMRLTGSQPWTAWDIARSFTVAPAIFLGGLWAYRVTKSKMAGVVGAAGVLFITGTRWLLLFLPDTILAWLSSDVELIGAGAAAGPTLITSLPNPWPVDGQASFPFPYAFENGIITPGVEVVHNVIGLMLPVLLFTLLLTASRWRNGWAVPATVILLSSIGLLTEIEFLLMSGAVLLIVIGQFIRNRRFKLPKDLVKWLVVWIASGLIIIIQGGAWTETAITLAQRLQGLPPPVSYQETGLIMASPSIVSHHLGVLSLLNLKSFAVALLEIGPVLLVLPLIVTWGLKAYRSGRWFEAILFIGAALSVAMVFVNFSGSLRNTSRLYFFVQVCVLMVVSSIWIWAKHRTSFLRWTTIALGGIVMFGGLVMLGVQLPNIKYHQFSFFISQYDAMMEAKYWDKLEPDALVLDPNPYRAPTVFGRHIKAATTWYLLIPEFEDLVANPDPYRIRKAGYSYVYLDADYWKSLTTENQSLLEQECVTTVDEAAKPGRDDWRILYDVSTCN